MCSNSYYSYYYQRPELFAEMEFVFQVILLKPKNQTPAICKKKNVHIALGKYWKHMAQNLEAVVFT